jgi:hypothetical protein
MQTFETIEEITSDYVAVLHYKTQGELESFLEHSWIAATYDISTARIYAPNHKILVIKKDAVHNTHFDTRSALTLEHIEVGEFIAFPDCTYQVTSLIRKPKYICEGVEDVTVCLSGVYIQKDGKQGKKRIEITYYPSLYSEHVGVKFRMR